MVRAGIETLPPWLVDQGMLADDLGCTPTHTYQPAYRPSQPSPKVGLYSRLRRVSITPSWPGGECSQLLLGEPVAVEIYNVVAGLPGSNPVPSVAVSRLPLGSMFRGDSRRCVWGRQVV